MTENTSFIAGLLDLSAGSIIAGLIASAVFYWLMFKDFELFCDSVKYWITSSRYDRHEMFSQEWWGETKIFIWLAMSAAVAYGVNSMGA